MTTKEYSYGIIIASDSRSSGDKKDLCIEAIKKTLPNSYKLKKSLIVSDDIGKIEKALKDFVKKDYDLILTSGGTGFSKRDNTPEASLRLIERKTPGISEAIRLKSREKTPMWALSRAVSGICKNSLIINLPGSPKACRESIEGIFPFLGHGLDVLKGDFKDHD